VTQAAIRSPAGMRGQSIAYSVAEAIFSCSPQPSFFDRLRLSAPEFACQYHLLEANVSERPFARPQRLFPFENHRGEVKRSWPIPSTKF
jgi:hypothetical protein